MSHKIIIILNVVAVAYGCISNLPSPHPVIQTTVPNANAIGRFFYVGGYFDLYFKGNPYLEGLQHTIAFQYAIKTIKTRYVSMNLLPGVDIGGIGFDNGFDINSMIQHTLNFQDCVVGYGNPIVPQDYTYGLVSPTPYEANKVLLPILKDRWVTTVGSCTGHSSFTNASVYFDRVSPQEKHFYQAFGKVLKSNLKWNVTQVVYSNAYGGESSAKLLESTLKSMGVCAEQIIPCSDMSMKDAVKMMENRKSVRAVILLLMPDEIIGFFRAVKDAKVALGSYTWMSTPYWVPNNKFIPMDLRTIAQGGVGVGPNTNLLMNLDPLENQFRTLVPTGQGWLTKFWQEYFKCNLGTETKFTRNCDVVNADNFKTTTLDPTVVYTIQATDALIIGIDSAIKARCNGASSSICSNFRQKESRVTIAEHVRKVKFNGVSFDNKGDNEDVNLKIWKFNGAAYEDIGEYQRIKSTNTITDVWRPQSGISSFDSVCAPTKCTKCNVIKVPTTTKATGGGPVVTVAPTTVSPENKTNRTSGGYPLRRESWVIPLVVLASLGLLIVIVFEIYLLSKMIGTKMVKSFRTMWLGQVLLFGIFLCYLVCFLFVVEQTKATCGMRRFGVGVSYALCFSVLLVKLMIVFSSHSVGYLRGVYQVLMLLFCWGVQIVIDSEWLILRLPDVIWVDGHAVCNHDYLGHIQSLVYVMALIFVCTCLAARAHGIITNHREGIFVGLAAGFSIPIWVAWTLVGALNKNTDFQDPTVAYGLLLNATLILFCMYLPKVRQLNSMGVEAIYLEDDNEREVYGSVIYGAPDKGGSVVYFNGGTGPLSYYPDSVLRGDPVMLKAHSEYMPAMIAAGAGERVDALHLKHPGSVKSAPAYGGTLRPRLPGPVIESPYSTVGGNGRVLRVTGDLTGKGHLDAKKAQSEIGYAEVKSPKSNRGTLRRSGSLTDLGAL